MRVLHVAPFFPPAAARGGMARAAGALCAALAAAGHEVTVFTSAGEAGAGEGERDGLRIRRFPGPRWASDRLVPFARGIADAIARGRFDLAHLHGHRSGMVRQAARALRLRGVGWVLQPHGTFPSHGQRRFLKAIWDWRALEPVTGARALIALSDAEARDLPRPAVVVGSGVAEILSWGGTPAMADRVLVPPWLTGAATTDDSASLPPRPPTGRQPAAPAGTLLFIGSDVPQKRLRTLVPLMHALPEARLDVVGPVARGSVAAFGAAAARVTAHGVLDDNGLARVLRAADVLVHPAVGEAFGMVPFEASLAGVPAVVAGGHGCGEWFARAGGCVVPPDDGETLIAQVRRRLEDRALGTVEAATVSAFVARELTWPLVAARVTAVYETVAGASSRGAARLG